ncbi:hypothetical protein OF83DRAFT_1146999 [Amylostereum chailletii]|nr:hypothetical protein OF83DRAFT_1146999 [Amylostereum chailletii]
MRTRTTYVRIVNTDDAFIDNLLDFKLPKFILEEDLEKHKTPPLLESFIQEIRMFTSLTGKFENEATQGLPISQLISLPFRRKTRSVTVKAELDICLLISAPAFPSRARLDFSIVGANSKLTTSAVVALHRLQDPPPKIQDVFWQVKPHNVEDFFSLLLFPGECRETDSDTNTNHLLFDLSVALHQQRAMGLDPVQNFGFTLSDGILRVYGMRNHPSTSDVQEMSYTFLCGLADHLIATILTPFLALTTEKIAHSLHGRSGQPSWRALATSRVAFDREPGAKTDGRGGARRSDHRGSGHGGSPLLTTENLESHTEWEGSVDILSYSGLSTSFRA